MSKYLFVTLGLVAALLLAVPNAQAQGLNVLFYGNSFTFGAGSTQSVNKMFELIATAAGHPTPRDVSAAVSGQDLFYHKNSNLTPIQVSIPPTEDWDFVVMQEHSTKLTRAFNGSPTIPAGTLTFPDSVAASQQDAIDLYNAVEARSANVVPVLYETWARGPGHAFYTGGAGATFPGGPSEMQAEVRDGYNALKSALDTEIGGNVAKIAPVGDAWEEANYDNLHSGDNWHAQNRGTMLAALVIYGTIYNDPTTSDIDLTLPLLALGLDASDGAFLTAAADATLAAQIPEPSSMLLGGSACLMGAALRRPKRACRDRCVVKQTRQSCLAR